MIKVIKINARSGSLKKTNRKRDKLLANRGRWRVTRLVTEVSLIPSLM